MNVQALAAANLPILCFDTCSILDIMRDPIREDAQPHDRRAGLDLLQHAEAGALRCIAAEQVLTEFQVHDQSIQEEATRNVAKHRAKIQRVDEIAAIFGNAVLTNTNHLINYTTAARAIVQRFEAQMISAVPSGGVPALAFARVNMPKPPARQGKESSKDCLIYETYLEAITNLRKAGHSATVVFLSSNKDDYCQPGEIPISAIAAEFAPINLQFATNMSMAKKLLGF